MSAWFDRGGFANPHLGEFLTPWISPLDMILAATEVCLLLRYYFIWLLRNNNMRRPGFEPRSIDWPSSFEPNTPWEPPPMNISRDIFCISITRCYFCSIQREWLLENTLHILGTWDSSAHSHVSSWSRGDIVSNYQTLHFHFPDCQFLSWDSQSAWVKGVKTEGASLDKFDPFCNLCHEIKTNIPNF